MSFELEVIKICTGCGLYKTLDKFYFRKRGEDRISKCRDCGSRINWEYRNTFDGFMKHLLSIAFGHSKLRLSKGRIEAGVFNLTFEYLVALWNWQSGKCYYSGIQMNPRPCSDWQCSLERLNNDLGYIAGNVAFVCLEFNSFTKWSLNKVEQVPFLINNQNESSISVEIENGLIGRKAVSTTERVGINNLGQYICNGCNTYKYPTEFYSAINIGCRDCHKLKCMRYNNTIKGHLQNLLSHAKSNTKRRNANQNKKTDHIFNITFEDLVAILKIQQGRCAYSNIKLNYGSILEKNWVASLERIDPTKGYILGNICIVCSEFNGSDQTTKMKRSNGGSGGWSQEKFKKFLTAIINRWFQQSGISNLTCVSIPSNNIQLEIII